MDFATTEGQRLVTELAEATLARLADDQRLRRVTDGWDRPTWHALTEAGLLTAFVPEAAGGGGMGILELCSLLVAVGARAVPVPILATLAMGAWPLTTYGGEGAYASLAALGEGRAIWTGAFAESNARDPLRPRVTARLRGRQWRLSGRKISVPAAQHASGFVVTARTEEGPALFTVERGGIENSGGDSGMVVEARIGIEDGGLGDLRLDDAPATLLAFGAEAVALWVDHVTVAICALQLGLAQGALRKTAHYVSSRTQFGVAVGSFQAVSQRMADGWIDTQTMEVTLWRTASRLARGEDARRDVHVARYTACNAAHRVLMSAQHLHGGIGFDRDYPLLRYTLLARQWELVLGGAAEHQARLGAFLAGAA